MWKCTIRIVNYADRGRVENRWREIITVSYADRTNIWPVKLGDVSIRFSHALSGRGIFKRQDFINDYLCDPNVLKDTLGHKLYLECLERYNNGEICVGTLEHIFNNAKYKLELEDLSYKYECSNLIELLVVELVECMRLKIQIKICDYCGNHFFHSARKTSEGKMKCYICPAPSKVYENDKFYRIKHSIYMKGVRQGKSKKEIEDMLKKDSALSSAPEKYKTLRQYKK